MTTLSLIFFLEEFFFWYFIILYNHVFEYNEET